MINERTYIQLLTLTAAGFAVLFFLSPLVYMGVVSLSEHADFIASGSSYKISPNNFLAVLTTPSLHFIDYLRNSLIVSLLSTAFCIVIVSAAAYAITRLNVAGGIQILFFVLAVSMFPQISMVGYLFKMMTGLGWINTYPALIFPYTSWILPLSLWILVSYFNRIPRDIDKAALIDGASRWQVLKKIILPLAAPGIVSTALLAFISAFNEFMFALTLSTDYRVRTVPVGIALFQGLHGETPWGTVMAASVITTVPIIILTIGFQRKIIQGLTRGAVKG